jgi:hypothetical protein
MSLQADYHGKLYIVSLFTGTGTIGSAYYKTDQTKTLRVVVEGVGGTNTVIVKGRLKGQAAWSSALATITSVSAGTSVDVSLYDEIELSCGVYDASGTPKVIASGFVY